MVIILLMMVNYDITGWWLTYPSEKYEWKSVGMITFPTEWKVIKFKFQTTNQDVLIINGRFSVAMLDYQRVN